MHLKIYTDGASRSNPGKAAIGILILDENDKEIYKNGEFIGIKTNNVAEYTALITALKKAKSLTDSEITCYSDSELMIRQLNEIYKVKQPHLKELYEQIIELKKHFKTVHFKHVRRTNEFIQICDNLANDALDKN